MGATFAVAPIFCTLRAKKELCNSIDSITSKAHHIVDNHKLLVHTLHRRAKRQSIYRHRKRSEEESDKQAGQDYRAKPLRKPHHQRHNEEKCCHKCHQGGNKQCGKARSVLLHRPTPLLMFALARLRRHAIRQTPLLDLVVDEITHQPTHLLARFRSDSKCYGRAENHTAKQRCKTQHRAFHNVLII